MQGKEIRAAIFLVTCRCSSKVWFCWVCACVWFYWNMFRVRWKWLRTSRANSSVWFNMYRDC